MRPTPIQTRKGFFAIFVIVLLGCIPSQAFAAQSSAKLYQQARAAYHAVLAQPDREQTAVGWQHCIKLLQKVMAVDRRHHFTDKCLYLIGQSYHHMYDASNNRQDFNAARHYYKKLIYGYPKSPLADDAQYLLGMLYLKDDPAQAYIELKKVALLFPHGDMCPRAELKALELKTLLNRRHVHAPPASAPAPNGQITPVANRQTTYSGSAPPTPGSLLPQQQVHSDTVSSPDEIRTIRYWSGDNYTRVVLYLSGTVQFHPHLLKAVPELKVPTRVYVDIDNCVMNPNLKPRIHIGDRLVKDVRVAQYRRTETRVVLDIRSMQNYRVFALPKPFRLIIDVQGKPTPALRSAMGQLRRGLHGGEPSLAQQLGLAVQRIVIDPGHGGKDTGAIGPGNVYEKTITLAIAKRLKSILEAETGCQVILTRSTDRYLSLVKRTDIANADHADLFISIHANANRIHKACGTETFYLNFANDKEAARVAAFENSVSTKKISNLETILKKLMLHSKIDESRRLAQDVQSHIIRGLEPHYHCLRNLGVKRAPFEVLIGAKMPAILIETAFITNRREERLLENHTFQERMAEAIASGVESYMHDMNRLVQVGGQS